MEDIYKTIEDPSLETLYKDKASKFYGYTFPISSEDDVKKHIETLRKQHHSARHFCYGWQLGTELIRYRVNDDGEPSNSAGMPIYGQIQAFGVTNILVVSVRYFGGVKLGVGGLINAYRNSAKLSLENSTIITKTIDVHFRLEFNYDEMNKVMRILKGNNIKILEQKLELNCQFLISVRKKSSEKIFQIFEALFKVKINCL